MAAYSRQLTYRFNKYTYLSIIIKINAATEKFNVQIVAPNKSVLLDSLEILGLPRKFKQITVRYCSLHSYCIDEYLKVAIPAFVIFLVTMLYLFSSSPLLLSKSVIFKAQNVSLSAMLYSVKIHGRKRDM